MPRNLYAFWDWRFVARRGQPRLFLSDNGSNFLGARKQIRRQPLQLDHEFIRQKLLNQSVEWRLNPPSAPHFGGVWERLLQIVERALLLNLGSAKSTRDTFSTIVTETESLVNARPLLMSEVISETRTHSHLITFWLVEPFLMSQQVSSKRIPTSGQKRGYKCDKDSKQSGKDFWESTFRLWTPERSRPNPRPSWNSMILSGSLKNRLQGGYGN